MGYKVFVFGLDGATFDLILPWVKEGRLPHFGRLLEQGSWAPLESAPNMRSPAAWTSFMTGKNPGKHGIFEFYEPIPASYDVRFIHGGMRTGKTLWTILSEHQKNVGVINVPMTYPAETVNGFLISGLDAPGSDSPSFCYPSTLLQELQSRFGTYILEPGLTGCIVGGNPGLAMEKLHEELDQKAKVTTYLMQRDPWDFFMVVFRSLDAVQHFFWKYMDSLHPQYNRKEAARFGTAILQAYQKIDNILGAIWNALDDDTVLMVMSDHGFGRRHPANIQLNQWLAQRGYLSFCEEAQGNMLNRALTILLGKAYRLTIGKTSRSAKETLARIFPKLRNRLQSRLLFHNIDWSRTEAYSDSLFPNIRINLEGREAHGIVKTGDAYRQLVAKLRLDLSDIRDSISGYQIVDRVFHRDEIYSGPFVGKAPDLLIRWKETENIHGILKNDVNTQREVNSLIPGEDPRIVSGDHRLHGVLLMAGKPIRQGLRLSQATIMDLAPTILNLLDLPIPADMDGAVLTDELTRDGSRPSRLSDIDAQNESIEKISEDGYSADEEEKVKERLRNLGYF
jgi:predicted AlkP superfamily phosphohydrolase/phosphomutase